MTTPQLSVIMPAYNAAQYLREAITSVLQQTFTDFELLVINDGSTDATENIIRSFADARIRLINQPHSGVSAALNLGLLNANAHFIARCDADDINLPQRFAIQLQFLQENPGYVLVGCDAVYIDRHGNFVFNYHYPAYTDDDIKKLGYKICPFAHPTVMYKKQAVLDAGMYDVHAHNFEDHLLWRKVVHAGKVCNIRKKLVQYRFNPESVTIDEKWRGKRFQQIKYAALQKGSISKTEGDELLHIIRKQNTAKIKRGSYYALLSKKYLFNNYEPSTARKYSLALIKIFPLKMQGYVMTGLSFFPEKILRSLYKIKSTAL
ncbi:MAG: glycosyltransferase [Bacteroidetes bacterium]|nr:glycosyltransferase [Bacteroidota bacterium]